MSLSAKEPFGTYENAGEKFSDMSDSGPKNQCLSTNIFLKAQSEMESLLSD